MGLRHAAEVHDEAIAYMAASRWPRFDDPSADAAWAGSLAEKLRPITRSLDKGAPEEKEKLDRVEIVGEVRLIDPHAWPAAADRQWRRCAPWSRAARKAIDDPALPTACLVVRCNVTRTCNVFQSTRDPTDVLCTTAPRHR